MRTVYLFLIAFVATVLLGRCGNEFTEQYDLPYDSSQSISFSPEIDLLTRCLPIRNAAELTSMGVFCAATGLSDWSATATSNKMFNEQLNNNSGTWTYQGPSVYWDANDLTERYSFFAYAPYASVNNGITVNGSAATQGKPTLSYTVPNDVAVQPDLMVAVPRYNVRPTGSDVSLQMKHALTCIGFQISGDEEQITGISISGVSVSGDLVIDGDNIVWTNLGAPTTTDFSASINYDPGKDYFTVTENMSTNFIAADGYLMMIPQALGSDAKVKISCKDGSVKEIGLDTYTWAVGKRITYCITSSSDGTIVVSPSEWLLPYTIPSNGIYDINVMCKKTDGTENANEHWKLTLNDSSWCRLSLSSSTAFNAATGSVSGNGSQTVYIIATDNAGTYSRKTFIYMNNAPADTVITVLQWGNLSAISGGDGGGKLPVNTTTYVGAFWKADQTGERIIRINAGADNANMGMWSATVMWLDPRWNNGDGVILGTDKLDNASLAARGISFSSDMNPDAYGTPEDCPVTGTLSSVSGEVTATDKLISFRIGLKSKYIPTTNYPARYAIVLLSYNNNTKHQKIFLRQGEESDYLMTNNDPVNSGGLSSRTVTKKFSPYSLTAQTLEKQVMTQADAEKIPAVSGNRSKFADYPTQTGAFWQWANIYTGTQFKGGIRWAFSPHVSGSQPWSTSTTTSFWSTIAADHETCPPGYRRPYDGSITGNEPCTDISGSELRQSFFLKPLKNYNNASETSNSVWGYYADGFFDRRQIVNGSGSEKTTVAANSKDIAHIGRLFFNPLSGSDHYNASIFVPAAGFLYPTTGTLSSCGSDGHFWSTSVNTDYGLALLCEKNEAGPWREDKTSGLMIRCVKK